MIKKHIDIKLHKENTISNIPIMAVRLSRNYFDAANNLRLRSLEDKYDTFPHSWHTFPAIIMFVVALETFINENYNNDFNEELSDKINIFVKTCIPGIKLSKCEWYLDALALIDIRNELVHYKPKMRDVAMCPSKVGQAILRTKIKLHKNLNYINNIANPAFADWSYKCVRKFGEEVSKNWWPGNRTLTTSEEYRIIMDSLCEQELKK